MLCGNGWTFIHTPKCGGTAVRKALARLPAQERGEILPMERPTVAHDFHKVGPPDERPDGIVFTTTRPPADWLRSYWAMRKFEGALQKDKVLDRLWQPDLNLFAVAVCRVEPGYVTELLLSYATHYENTKVLPVDANVSLGIQVSLAVGENIELTRENQTRFSAAPYWPDVLEFVKETQPCAF